MNALASLLLDAGLIQFGWFRRGGDAGGADPVPFALELEMLASYPVVLRAVVEAAQARMSSIPATRLLCPADSLPFGVACAAQSGIPLVYSRGSSDAPVFDLVGAYDIGHVTLLLANTPESAPPGLAAGARRVGLDVRALLPILAVHVSPAPGDVAVFPLLRLADVVRECAAEGRLAPKHAQAVLDWLEAPPG
jgi:hypothetical protein